MPDYDKMKGEFIWELDVRPTLLRHDGMWKRMMVGVNDTFTPGDLVDGRVVLAAPAAAPDSDNMIYTFKKMVGNQAADSTYLRIFAPHLFSGFNGPNPYWGIPEVYPGYDWGPAIQDAEDYLGLLDDYFSGSFNFVDTVMYLTVNHEVAPKEDAYNACSDCHGSGQIDWTALGYLSDPLP